MDSNLSVITSSNSNNITNGIHGLPSSTSGSTTIPLFQNPLLFLHSPPPLLPSIFLPTWTWDQAIEIEARLRFDTERLLALTVMKHEVFEWAKFWQEQTLQPVALLYPMVWSTDREIRLTRVMASVQRDSVMLTCALLDLQIQADINIDFNYSNNTMQGDEGNNRNSNGAASSSTTAGQP
ncbi:hypothetical protein BGZ83_009906 [Gryganskiella cystojenkinii]|nr:hypothetical protein BGZ83_009906 [Gryganskiella cystojenkinii]